MTQSDPQGGAIDTLPFEANDSTCRLHFPSTQDAIIRTVTRREAFDQRVDFDR